MQNYATILERAAAAIEEFTRKGHTPATLPLSGGYVVMDNGVSVDHRPDKPETVRVWDHWGVKYVDVTCDGGSWVAGDPVAC